MRAIIRPIAAAVSIACMSSLMLPVSFGVAFAQDKSAPAEEALKQIALTDKQIDGVIAAKADVDAILQKIPEGTDQPDPKVLAQLDAAAKKHGFANYAEYDSVLSNINFILEGFDPDTKKYVGQETILKKEIAEVQADKKMSAKDKKDALAELNESLKQVAPVQFQANIQLVGKYYDKLAALAPQDQK